MTHLQNIIIAKILLKINAVSLNVNKPFEWSSGIKSPIYTNCRLITSFPDARTYILEEFMEIIMKNFPKVDVVAGVATGGIPLGMLIADRLNRPFIYVRQSPKEHGLGSQIEGFYKKGDKVLVVEDLVSTGASSMNAINGLREGKLNVLGLISVMTYKLKSSIDMFEKEGIIHHSLCDLDGVLNAALMENKITAEERQYILNFRNNLK
jgi:orotate phosphoribosyltransferase